MSLSYKELKKQMKLKIYKFLGLKVIETPNLPTKPFSPQPKKNFLVSFLISFIAFYSLLYYRELNSSVIKSPRSDRLIEYSTNWYFTKS